MNQARKVSRCLICVRPKFDVSCVVILGGEIFMQVTLLLLELMRCCGAVTSPLVGIKQPCMLAYALDSLVDPVHPRQYRKGTPMIFSMPSSLYLEAQRRIESSILNS
jgi:hypothetical protein